MGCSGICNTGADHSQLYYFEKDPYNPDKTEWTFSFTGLDRYANDTDGKVDKNKPYKYRIVEVTVADGSVKVIENNEYLSDMGKTYEILNNTDKISFTVTGKRSIIEELSESDFTAVANLENINDDMTTIPVSVSASRYASQIEINKRDATLKVSVENLQTERFSVKVATKGTPAAYCYVESTSSAPGKITVTGPESVVSQIKTAQAVVDISNAEENVAKILEENPSIEVVIDLTGMGFRILQDL